MNTIVNRLSEFLASSPDGVLPQRSIGPSKPSSGSDLPGCVIGLSIESQEGLGIGRFVRSGDSVVQHTGVIQVLPSPETFSPDLRLLRIKPLPLKQNPSSTNGNFGDGDISIRNVTDMGRPLPYRLTATPEQREEYRLDVARAQILFGQPQMQGETLEVVHWTVSWRDEILGMRYVGTLFFEIWTDDPEATLSISQKLQDKIRLGRGAAGPKGFRRLRPSALEPAENFLHIPPVGSPFSVWKQRLSYRFVFELEEGGELSSGIPITRIDVDMRDHHVERFTVPSRTSDTR